jgi:hypothetical protein
MICEVNEKNGKRILRRVVLNKILDKKTRKDKTKLVLIVWKGGLYEEDNFKKFGK